MLESIESATCFTRSAFQRRPKTFSGNLIVPDFTPFRLYTVVSILCFGPSDLYYATSVSRDCSADKDLTSQGLDLNDLEIFDRYILTSHPAGHPHTLDHATTGPPTTTDGSRLTLTVLLPV